jgi:hypothetical protein
MPPAAHAHLDWPVSLLITGYAGPVVQQPHRPRREIDRDRVRPVKEAVHPFPILSEKAAFGRLEEEKAEVVGQGEVLFERSDLQH